MELNKNYERNAFLSFLKDVLIDDFNKDIRSVSTDGLTSIKKAFSLGKSEALNLQIFEFEFIGSSRKRVTLTKEAFKLMRDSACYQALAVFHSVNSETWRFSFLTADPVRTDKGSVGLVYSNPKRYSFLLGFHAKVNTPYKYLVAKGKIVDILDLKQRFSIEVVNKDFYKEVSTAFTQLVGGTLLSGKTKTVYGGKLKLPSTQNHGQVSLEFAVRLIGRIIFCWFLREKRSSTGNSLMPPQLVSFDALQEIDDYYHKVLEPIFFEVLNIPIKSRKDTYSKNLFAAIPYLNGGLFSPHQDDYYSYNEGKQTINHNLVIIPDEWFKSFFEILETYNFTIDENTSYDEELSIDPEMLGRIFENLLAEINPETGESARKSTGSYYTPRVIVDYMIDESLLLYLKEITQIDEEKIRALISYDLDDDLSNPLTDEEKEKVTESLNIVKILDPACGSGAFPIGALQKIVFILQQIDPQGQLWFKNQMHNTPIELRRLIEREFQEKNFDYLRKLGIIRENIYGVDIQPIATEISRLRCFLTLVVDERIDDSLDNRGIEPLPNLDFKFVTANTLIGLPQTGKEVQMGMFEDEIGINELREIRNMFFNASGFERDQLKLQFVQTQNKMFQRLISEGRRGHAELTSKLTSWDPFSHKTSDWFDPEWMFGIKNGFDIVIANPPYIDSEGMVNNHLEELREYIVSRYEYTRGNWDIYIAFFEKGFKSLNKDGILTYISPDKWISKPFGNELRKHKYANLYSILNAGRKVFESAKVDSIVSIFHNKKNHDNLNVLRMTGGRITHIRNFEKKRLNSPFLLDCVFSKHLNLITKIETHLSDKNTLNCENACATSDAYKLAPLLSNLVDSFNNENQLKIINTGTISKWRSRWGTKEMTYLGNKYLKPVVQRDQFFKTFPNSYSQKSIKPKLILKGLNLLDVCIDEKGEIIPGKSTLIITGFDIQKMKLIMAYLNSPLPFFFIKEKYPAASYNQGTSFTKDMINNLPVPPFSSEEEKLVIHFVDEILNALKDHLTTLNIEPVLEGIQSKINIMIYKTFNLSSEEILIIEDKNHKNQ